MNRFKTALAGGAIAASMLVGGVIGAAVTNGSAIVASAATTAATTTPSPAAPSAANGKFVPNEDPAHEATESAQREAQEDAGQVPTVP